MVNVKLILISSFGGVLVLASILIIWRLGSAFNKLNRRLKKINPLLNKESSEAVKKLYLEIYELYLKLSEKKKLVVYSKIKWLREEIETNLRTEKKMEELLSELDQKGVKQLKAKYTEIYNLYRSLPEKVQSRYYSQVTQLRTQLEGN